MQYLTGSVIRLYDPPAQVRIYHSNDRATAALLLEFRDKIREKQVTDEEDILAEPCSQMPFFNISKNCNELP